MLVSYMGVHFYVPDEQIEMYFNIFPVLRGSENRDNLEEIRESIHFVYEQILKDPTVLYDQNYLDDLQTSFAMKQALQLLGMLYDA